MVMWGVIFGAILGLLWHGHDWSSNIVIGAVLGAIAGATLRSTIRSEVQKAMADKALVPAAARPGASPAVRAPSVPVVTDPPPERTAPEAPPIKVT